MAEYPGAAWAGVSPNRSDRQGRVRLFIVHHYAGTQDPASARARFMSSNDRSVSPNYQVNADGSVYEIVPPDRFRAWTTGTIDHQAVTCETQNTSGAPTWGISRESHQAIAHLIAWASQRYGFPIQRGAVADGDRVTVPGVVGHRETPAGKATGTACPGPSMDLDWIVNRARQIAGGSAACTETKEWDEMATKDEVKDAMRDVLNERSFGAASIVPLTDGGIYLVSGITGRHAHIENPYHLTLIQRALKNNSNDMMAGAELAIVRGYLTAVNPPPLAEVDTDALAEALGKIDNDADEAAIEAAVKRAIASAVTEIRLTTPPAQ